MGTQDVRASGNEELGRGRGSSKPELPSIPTLAHPRQTNLSPLAHLTHNQTHDTQASPGNYNPYLPNPATSNPNRPKLRVSYPARSSDLANQSESAQERQRGDTGLSSYSPPVTDEQETALGGVQVPIDPGGEVWTRRTAADGQGASRGWRFADFLSEIRLICGRGGVEGGVSFDSCYFCQRVARLTREQRKGPRQRARARAKRWRKWAGEGRSEMEGWASRGTYVS
ncbi:hypothetical protein Salat_2128500 [Sesamum alatum]|uniref:Uncharacterized protein n=1 Tax=Sesamum alatum TaxID=300844 RepID=A0AAE1Y180_9LAMI|nr:hypothetical protein Salat_2128500 [Sesamum alatum]